MTLDKNLQTQVDIKLHLHRFNELFYFINRTHTVASQLVDPDEPKQALLSTKSEINKSGERWKQQQGAAHIKAAHTLMGIFHCN